MLGARNGRGFTVVATEIGELANKTFETVDGINQMVQEVNHTISESTQGVNLIAEKSQNTVEKTAEGYSHLRDSNDNLTTLKSLIEKFELYNCG